jgi:zinc transporter ZupT
MHYVFLILTVLFSFGFVAIAEPKKSLGLQLLLSFSGAFLLALTIFHLFPEVYSSAEMGSIGIFIMLGILLQIILEFFSKGAEHGHIHWDQKRTSFPWMLFISLCIHSFMEGLPLSDSSPIYYGILIHKIPIAIILSMFLINSKMSRLSTVFFILFFSLMTPLGSFLGAHIEFITTFKPQITAVVIGILLHISTVILFESSKEHVFNMRKLGAICLGILVAYLI